MLTATAVGRRIGLTPARVRQIAQREGIGKKVETQVGPVWRFTERDVKRLAAARRPPGRPKAR